MLEASQGSNEDFIVAESSAIDFFQFDVGDGRIHRQYTNSIQNVIFNSKDVAYE